MSSEVITLKLEASVETAVRPSRRVCEVAAMFGLGVDERKTVRIVPPARLRLGPGRVVFITGASGGGKSTLLRLIREAAADRPDARVIDFDAIAAAGDDRPLMEGFASEPDRVDPHDSPSLEDAVRWLSLAGLNDAFVMLRRPGELSDGQRYRLRLARAMAEVERGARREESGPGPSQTQVRLGGPWRSKIKSQRSPIQNRPPLTLVLADEFGATLDRLTAKVVARNVRKWTRRPAAGGTAGRVCFIAATTHDDLLEPLEPDTLIVQHPGEAIEVMERGRP